MKPYIILLVTAFLVGGLWCRPPKPTSPCPPVVIKKIYDSTWKTISNKENIGKGDYHSKTSALPAAPERDSFIAQIDSYIVIDSFLTRRFYSNTYKDSTAEIKVEDSIYQNKLQWRRIQYKITQPQTIVIASEKSFNTLYGGITLSYPFGISLDILIKDKKDRIYGMGIAGNKAISFKYYQPIFKF